MQRNFPAMLSVLAFLGLICVPGAVSGQNSAPGNIHPAPQVNVGHADLIPGAPDFQLQDLNGKIVRLQDFRGKAVALNFWTTWCVPCKTEMPWLNEFQKQY